MQQIGRLAMRREGIYWNAYYTMPNTMVGALHLGSIAMVFVEREERRVAFLNFMREVVADILEEKIGTRPDMNNVQPAPESERSGHS